ncbi:hypothetical protein VNO80_25452 [Phaseolus coccineus]|uniref:Phosphofructokinase domain-containing protein n=1 Tax=Phaseolus coccineus TaxID=3886 RepID=A0AAN9QP09_PHACN
MFRTQRFIALYATLASRDVDCCLIPESPFYLEGPGQELISESIQSLRKQDASGNKLLQDVGLWISQKIKILVWLSMFETKFSVHFMNLKCCPLFLVFNFMILYETLEKLFKRIIPICTWFMRISKNPTYMIRAIPSNASDNVYCTPLAQSAVHGAMAGYTGFTSGLVNGRQTYIPFYVSSASAA